MASWCRSRTCGSILPNFPSRELMVWVQIQRLSYLTFSVNASSVPGSMQTATPGSRSLAKPRVDVPRKVVVTTFPQPQQGGKPQRADYSHTSDCSSFEI